MCSDDEIYVSKSIMPILPEGYEETCLGSPRGAFRQYRHKSGVHLREYNEWFAVHQDRFDPRTKPFLHLAVDSPETIVALGSALILSKIQGSTSGSGKSKTRGISATLFGFLLMFVSLDSFFRGLKHLLFG